VVFWYVVSIGLRVVFYLWESFCFLVVDDWATDHVVSDLATGPVIDDLNTDPVFGDWGSDPVFGLFAGDLGSTHFKFVILVFQIRHLASFL